MSISMFALKILLRSLLAGVPFAPVLVPFRIIFNIRFLSRVTCCRILYSAYFIFNCSTGKTPYYTFIARDRASMKNKAFLLTRVLLGFDF